MTKGASGSKRVKEGKVVCSSFRIRDEDNEEVKRKGGDELMMMVIVMDRGG